VERTPERLEVEGALEKILASQGFSQSTRLTTFLKFVVSEALEGRGDRLKGYTIATEVFGKPADFDANTDPYVRVEAGRLRQRLADYYAGEGARDTVRIDFKRGSYAPRFRYVAGRSAPRETAPSSNPPPRSRQLPTARIAIVAVVAAAAVVTLVWRARDALRPAPAHGPPRVLVQPFQNVGDSEFDYFAHGLTEEILVNLSARLDSQSFERYAVSSAPDGSLLNVEEVAPDYVLTGTVSRAGNVVRATARLTEKGTDRQIWANRYEDSLTSGNFFTVQARIADEVAAVIAEPFGAVNDAEVARSIQNTRETLDSYDCRLRYSYALQTFAPDAQEPARACLERLGSTSADWAILSLLYRWEYDGGYDLRDDTPPSIDRARAAALRAIELDRRNPLGYDALALVQASSNDYAAALESIEQALEHNPNAATRAAIGSNLIRLGEPERGMKIWEAAVAQSPRTSPYFFLGPTFLYVKKGDYATALTWAERIDAPQFIIGQTLIAALAAREGEDQLARTALARVLALQPRFSEIGRTLMHRWGLEDGEIDVLIEGFVALGVPIA
jgi:adenylate cyclase